MSTEAKEHATKEHVVISNGQRATGLVTEKEANQEAARLRQRLNEKAGNVASPSTVQVKQNICG